MGVSEMGGNASRSPKKKKENNDVKKISKKQKKKKYVEGVKVRAIAKCLKERKETLRDTHAKGYMAGEIYWFLAHSLLFS